MNKATQQWNLNVPETVLPSVSVGIDLHRGRWDQSVGCQAFRRMPSYKYESVTSDRVLFAFLAGRYRTEVLVPAVRPAE